MPFKTRLLTSLSLAPFYPIVLHVCYAPSGSPFLIPFRPSFPLDQMPHIASPARRPTARPIACRLIASLAPRVSFPSPINKLLTCVIWPYFRRRRSFCHCTLRFPVYIAEKIEACRYSVDWSIECLSLWRIAESGSRTEGKNTLFSATRSSCSNSPRQSPSPTNCESYVY